MRRLSRAVALTAVTLALPLGVTACKDEQEKSAAAPAKPGETAPAPITPSKGTGPAAGAARSTTPPAQPGAATPAESAPPKKPDSVKDKHVAAADSILARADKFGDALQAAKGDCKKATAALKSSAPELKQVMADTDKLQTELGNDYPAMKWFQKTYGQRMMVSLKKVGSLLQQCRNDKEFMAAFEKLGIGRPRRRPGAGSAHEAHGGLPPAAMAAPPAKPTKEAEPRK